MTARDPDTIHVSIAKQAIPQYTVGHSKRVKTIENNLYNQYNNKLHLIGNSYNGVGVADTVANGLAIGRKVAEQLYPKQ